MKLVGRSGCVQRPQTIIWCCNQTTIKTLATVSGCYQLVVGPIHARGGALDLLMTDVPDLVRVAVAAPIGNSDYPTLSTVISMERVIPNLCVIRKVLMELQVF